MTRSRFSVPIDVDPFPDLPVERGQDGQGVGWWVPGIKHTLLAKWIDGTRAARRKSWRHLVLIDPFSGPARIQVRGENFTRPGGCAVAWLQSQRSGVPFTQVMVGDIDPARAEAAQTRLRAAGAPVSCFVGPAAQTVPQMKAQVPSGALVLAYVDPYNLAFLSHAIIKELAALKAIDFAVHFSVYDMFRNVGLEWSDERARFDDAAPGWRNAIDAASLSKAELRQAFFEYWMRLIADLGFTFSRAMPLVFNDRNAPVYRLACFSRHALPNKVWDDVAKDSTGDLFA